MLCRRRFIVFIYTRHLYQTTGHAPPPSTMLDGRLLDEVSRCINHPLLPPPLLPRSLLSAPAKADIKSSSSSSNREVAFLEEMEDVLFQASKLGEKILDRSDLLDEEGKMEEALVLGTRISIGSASAPVICKTQNKDDQHMVSEIQGNT
ncbi:uncharacterized protein LOC119334740 isoform X2 [Triticum dicoccoides]|uniref:uncharacterized protein LOC119334740 isoform X2 n=1 Tax=Triticum dicoccoides TaxID=85692 RepID=UPI0018919BEA|nr:uncharacterized protein LOC119334740 isoform X2 [Triticum dicoccoides]